MEGGIWVRKEESGEAVWDGREGRGSWHAQQGGQRRRAYKEIQGGDVVLADDVGESGSVY